MAEDRAPRLAGICAEAERPPDLRAGLSCYWSHPERGLRVLAGGEVARREGGDPPGLLSALSRPDAVAWLDGPGDARPRPPGPWFGAIAFDPARGHGPRWRGFASVRFAAPDLMWWTEARRTYVAAFALVGEATRAALQARLDQARRAQERHALSTSAGSERLEARNGVRVEPAPHARQRWSALVDLALQHIRRGDLSKVVLARCVEVRAEAPLAPEPLLSSLERRYPSCRTFLLRGDRGCAFLGATPETFCSLDGARLDTEALAGSARPGEGRTLLERPKELREHGWVTDHIAAGLRRLSERVETPGSPGVRELANVAHLHTPISARLRAGVGISDVVEALHPTPAVGGVPVSAAVRFLAEHEDLDRGLYAGLLGFVGPGRAELAVALRCALLQGERARLFVGAGIVEGSSEEEEWVETELKARALLGALGAAQ